jgi:hypothetical protein
MRVGVTSNIGMVLADSRQLQKQARFAVAKALSDTVRDAQAAMPQAAESSLQRPTQFTKRGFYYERATKERLIAAVGIKPIQAEYLRYQVDGGVRVPRNVALRLPAVVDLTPEGNLPAGTIRTLIQRARAGRRATAKQAKRFGVSSQLDLFYGEPGDGRPAGIYKRVVISKDRHQLVPIVLFPRKSARYTKRFDFHGVAERVVRDRFTDHLEAAWRLALATAR